MGKQEIVSLRWNKIDFEFGNKGIITLFRTKNSKDRTEFLMPRTREALLNWKDHIEKKRKKVGIRQPKTDSVFCRINGDPIKDFKKAWQQALRFADMKNLHFHDLRHTFCSNLILSGANLKEVKDMIGHSHITVTDRYSHLSLSHKLLRQNHLANHYSKGNLSKPQKGTYLVQNPQKPQKKALRNVT